MPWEVVHVDPAISPRDGANTDRATVERYAEILDDLPAITVQRDTFRLIDGKHRTEAAAMRGSYVRIHEVDVPDDELFEQSYLANTMHGRPLSDRERAKAAKRIWDAKVALGETPNQSEFARQYQVSRRTVVRFTGGAPVAQSVDAPTKPDSPVEVPLKPRPTPVTKPKRVAEELLRWSDEEHPIAYDDDGEDSEPLPFEPAPKQLIPGFTRADIYVVINAVQVMQRAREASVNPGDFLAPAERYALFNQLTLTDFEQAHEWFSRAVRWLRVGQEVGA